MSEPSSDDLRWARVLLVALAAFSGVTVTLAEGGPRAAAVLPFALASVLLIDLPDRRGLPGWIAAGLGLVAFAVAAAEFLNGGPESKLLAGVHLLTYLLCVLMLVRKGPADLGRILILSLLQIALASLLSNSVWLGVGLLAGLILAVWAMITIQWLLMTDRSAREAVAETSTVRRLFGPSLRVAALAAAGGAALFTVVPRVWTGQLTMFNNIPLPGTDAETGFSEEVRLGDVGAVMENSDIVLTVESRRVSPGGRKGGPINFEEVTAAAGQSPSLLRGAVMGGYEGGTWTQYRAPRTFMAAPLRDSDLDEFEGFVHRFELEPLGSDILFSPGWIELVAARDAGGSYVPVPYDAVRFGLLRPADIPMTERVSYEIFTPAEVESTDPAAITNPNGQRLMAHGVAASVEIPPLLQTDLARYVRDAVPEAAAAARAGRPVDAAAAITEHFADAETFTYTLDLKVVNREIDPVLDFLRNRRSGHCEYYASALALLLRSQGVAARVVNGFKGGDWNAERELFEVRQLHAHAWVEVYAPDAGRWATFDPTPAARDAAVAETSNSARNVGSPWQWVKSAWYGGVFMTRSRQKQEIYEPLAEAFTSLWEVARNYPRLVRAYWLGEETVDGRRVTLGKLLAPLLVVVAAAAAAWWVVRAVRRRRRNGKARREGRGRRRPADAPDVPWFDRFLTLAERRTGLQRDTAQTPHEYVAQIGKSEAADVASVGRRLTPWFYSARFGRKDVPAAEVARAAADLDALERPG